MECLDQGGWQSFLDGELSAGESAGLKEHLDHCPACRTVVEGLTQLNQWSDSHLEIYHSALETVLTSTDAKNIIYDPKLAPIKQKFKGGLFMNNKLKKWIGAAVAGLLLVGTLTLPPVRQGAADILSLFRVQKIQAVQITPDQLKQMAQAIQSKAGHIDLKQFGQVQIAQQPVEKKLTLAEAKTLLPFTLKQPTFLPSGTAVPEKVSVLQAGKAQFNLNVDQVNALLKSLGSTTLLPETLKGKQFTINIPSGVQMAFNQKDNNSTGRGFMGGVQVRSAGKNEFSISQFASPEVIVPSGVDPAVLRAALLDLPILPSDLRNQLASIQDWKNTMVIPTSGNQGETVNINGNQGVFSNNNNYSTLIWVDQGVIYQIGGNLDRETALNIAKSLK